MIIRAILFDIGDTLIHTDRFDYDECLRKMHQSLAKDGIKLPYEDFKKEYFIVRDRFYKETDKTLEEQDFAKRIADTLRPLGIKLQSKDKRVQRAVEAFMDCFVDSLTIEDYLPKLLRQLRSEYKLAVVSNMSFAKAGFDSLEKFGIAEYFDAILISGAVGWRKPSPKIFQEALKRLGVKADEAVFVGDSPRADIEGAKKLGIKTVLLAPANKQFPATDTYRLYVGKGADTETPHQRITELAELPRALESLIRNF